MGWSSTHGTLLRRQVIHVISGVGCFPCYRGAGWLSRKLIQNFNIWLFTGRTNVVVMGWEGVDAFGNGICCSNRLGVGRVYNYTCVDAVCTLTSCSLDLMLSLSSLHLRNRCTAPTADVFPLKQQNLNYEKFWKQTKYNIGMIQLQYNSSGTPNMWQNSLIHALT